MTAKIRKTAVRASDLAILAMMSGADALDSMLVGHTNPVAVLEKVIATFTAYGKDPAELVAKRDLFASAKGNGVKGRKAPIVGETRGYSAQQIGEDGDLFIRLPLNSLPGCSKGDKVNVTFNGASISCELAPKSVTVATSDAATLQGEADADADASNSDDLDTDPVSDEGEALDDSDEGDAESV